MEGEGGYQTVSKRFRVSANLFSLVHLVKN